MRGIEGGRGRRRERHGGSRKAACLPSDRQAVPAVDAVRALLRRAHAPETGALKRIWYNRLKCDRMGT